MTDYPMPATALRELHKIEQERNVKIIYACESGSRAWGFPSKTSDFDIRFIYVRPSRAYLSLASRRDVIDSNDLGNKDPMVDIGGWDILKTLELAGKSNPQVIEWLRSDIVYYEDDAFFGALDNIMANFNRRAVMHHYASHANSINQRRLKGTGEKTMIKSYLYIIRCLFMCISLDKTPEVFPTLNLSSQFWKATAWREMRDVYPIIRDIIAQRPYTNEEEMTAPIPELERFIEEYIPLTREMAKAASNDSSPDLMSLDHLSYETIRRFF